MYDGDWLSRRAVDLLPEQYLRVPFEGLSPDQAKAFEAIDKTSRHPDGVIQAGLSKGRLYGGAAIILGINGGGKPETEARVGRGRLEWLDVAHRGQLQGLTKFKDANRGNFGEWESVKITGSHPRTGLVLHTSRIIWCEGDVQEREDLRTATEGIDLPWQSVLEIVYDTLADYGISWRSLSHLLHEASIGVLTLKGLIDMLASENQADAEARAEVLSMGKSVAKTIFLDADHGEKFERTNVSFADLPQVYQQIAIRVAAALDVPVTRLFGISPAGMNATGESDTRQWYERLEAYGRVSVQPKVNTVVAFLTGAPKELKWAALWQTTDLEKEQIRKTRFEGDKLLYDMAAVEGGDVALSRDKDGTLGIDLTPERKKAIKEELKNGDTVRSQPGDQTPSQNPDTGSPGTITPEPGTDGPDDQENPSGVPEGSE